MQTLRARACVILVACLLLNDPALAEQPWRLRDALALPAWVKLDVQHRLRYESLDGQYRAGGEGGDQQLALQTLAHLRLGSPTLKLGLEMLDARVFLDDAASTLDPGMVNSAELLQGYIEWQPDTGAAQGAMIVKAGRQTIDYGTRRLIARNRFRNTVNAFNGLGVRFTSAAGHESEAFVVVPVIRLPTARTRLQNNEASFDEEDFGTVLWLASWRSAPGPVRLEAYLIGLNETDGVFDTRNRRLQTPGLRLFREPAPGRIDFQLELVQQLGEVRGSTASTDRADLDHHAHYESLHLGYTFEAPWSPRAIAMFDYARGDEDPTDDDNQRFDTLYGARRFEYGPSGIFGPFLRTNMLTPGWRLNVTPRENLQAFIGHRAYWLASDRDIWLAANLRDTTGQSGSFIGHQLEACVTWQLIPDTLALEAGGAWLSEGEFREAEQGRGDPGASSYLYTQFTLSY